MPLSPHKTNRLCPHQPIEQRPRQHKTSQSTLQPARPQLQRPAEVPACVQQRGLLPGSGERLRGDAHDVEQQRGQHCGGDVEEEAGVGLEAEDAGGDAKERGG